MHTLFKSLINTILGYFGYKIGKKSSLVGVSMNMDSALFRCAKRGIEAATVIDIGASSGIWTEICFKYFPNSNYLLLDGNIQHEKSLKNISTKYQNMQYKIGVIGDREGDIYFDDSDLFGGAASYLQDSGRYKKSSMYSVDFIIQETGLAGPYILKMDTHGFEVPILEGAKKTLENTVLIIIEAYNHQIANASLKFWELCTLMESKGFRPIEIADPSLRKYDHSFWQVDIFFIKTDRPEFQYLSYQ